MSTIPRGIYRHYKGNQYEVIGFAKHSETLEDMVVYRPHDGERGDWVRPLSMWNDPIEIDEKTVKRFEYIVHLSLAERPICWIDVLYLSMLDEFENGQANRKSQALTTFSGA